MPQRHGHAQAKSPVASMPVQADSGFRITTTNENWRGKNDPAERRRIQNRLNQRAFRERQRAGEATKPYNPRGDPVGSKSPDKKPESGEEEDDDDDEKESDDEEDDDDESEEDDSDDEDDSDEDDDEDDDEDTAEQSNPGSPPPSIPQSHFTGQVSRAARAPSTPSTDNPWDELAQLINRNFMQAAATNAQHLGLDLTSLRSGTASTTPRPRNPPTITIPQALKPTEVQHQLPHDPIIDTIPHARLRFNILRAIATGNLDAARFSACLRRSGAVVNVQGEPRRSGLVVWNSPDQLASWELTEAFVLLWGFLLEGCEDFVNATNVWRAKRGEKALVAGGRGGAK